MVPCISYITVYVNQQYTIDTINSIEIFTESENISRQKKDSRDIVKLLILAYPRYCIILWTISSGVSKNYFRHGEKFYLVFFTK